MNIKAFEKELAIFDKEIERLKGLFKPSMSMLAKQILKNKVQEIKNSKHEYKTSVYEEDRLELDSFNQMVNDVKVKYGYNSWR